MVSLQITELDPVPPAQGTQAGVTFRYAKLSDTVPVIVDMLRKNRGVLLNYDQVAAWVDRKTGIMSPSAMNYPGGGAPLPRKARNFLGMPPNGHLVQIVGAAFNPDGSLRFFKIKNSWGKNAGDRGYYYMYADYFEPYAIEIELYETPDLILPLDPKTEPMLGTPATP